VPRIEVNGVDLYWIEHGDGPVGVIFGHGLLGSSSIWRDFYFPILPEGWHAYALDFRGHGESRDSGRGCTFRHLSEDVAAFAAAMGLDRYFYVGLSMGGGVGLQLALKHREHLLGLGLVSSVTGLGPLGSRWVLKFGPLFMGHPVLVRRCLGMATVFRHHPKDMDAAVAEAMLVSRETLREYLEPANVIEGVERLGGLDVPATVVIAARDRIIPVKQQRMLAETLPDCTLLMLPDNGHAAAAENPRVIMAHLRDFVDSVVRPGKP
jgi:pimeloyl-ACP methyl ester carboxylesterase